jgi:putative ATP-dependent endonuclease of the OLD family
MRLVSITIENFRSIKTARKVPIGQTTTLLGPNNEGKSNILRALYIGMSTLQNWNSSLLHARIGGRVTPTPRKKLQGSRFYSWETDFPIALQAKRLEGVSNVTLEFSLNENEIIDFKSVSGSSLNGTLPIQLSFGPKSVDVQIAKQGKGNAKFNQNKPKIIDFVAAKIDIQYIPAVRTANHVDEIVERLVERELRSVENNDLFKEALAKVHALQAPILASLSENISKTISKFIPSVKSATILNTNEGRISALRSSTEIIVDDGVATPLRFKGDGVQSLVALAMMRHSSLSQTTPIDTIVALEEPESHLHPKAIHELKAVLGDLSESSQIVLTTHNPVFVSRSEIASNIIVNQSRAYAAKDISEIRKVLGVQVSDNLRGAELVLIVEGLEDEVALRGIIGDCSETLKSALTANKLAFDPLGGAGNLIYKAGLHKANICKVYAFLDDDHSGRQAFEKSSSGGVLKSSDVSFAMCDGHTETELEDLYDDSFVADILSGEGVDIKRARDKKEKWSDRVISASKVTGKKMSDATLMNIKRLIAEKASILGIAAIHKSKRGPIDGLIKNLEQRIVAEQI